VAQVIEQLPEGAAQIKVWHADQLIDIAPQAYTVTASPGKLTLQLSVVPSPPPDLAARLWRPASVPRPWYSI
jgi:hypothetical protein